MSFTPIEYLPSGKAVVADAALLNKLAKYSLRELIRRTGLSQHTLEAIRRGQTVRPHTLVLLKQALHFI